MDAMTVDVVGGAQALAREWLRLEQELADANTRLMEAQNKRSTICSRQEDAAKRLAERVGRNIPTKVFVIDTFAVVVDVERGIHSYRIEK